MKNQNHIIVIGTSAGGVEALKSLLSALPKQFSAPILIVMHISPHLTSRLPDILSRHTSLKIIIPPYESQTPQGGEIYIAPSNLHMILKNGKIILHQGPKINHSRPAIDPLFFSAAAQYGPHVVGVLLSGLLDDGCAGLLAIKRNKGITIVQDPEEATYADMPQNALTNVPIDYCMKTKEIAQLLVQITQKTEFETLLPTRNELLEHEIKMNMLEKPSSEEDMNKIGNPSVFACPDCHAVLWEVNDPKITRFRCRVGHAYGLESLRYSIDAEVENALWSALKALEEKENLTERIAEKAKLGDPGSAYTFLQKAKNLKDYVKTIRLLLSENRE